MSDPIKDLRQGLSENLKEEAQKLSEEFSVGLKAVMADAPEESLQRVEDAFRRAAKFRAKAEFQKDELERQDYLSAAEASEQSAKTIMLAEELVKKEQVADLIVGAFRSAAKGLMNVAAGSTKALIKVAKEGKLDELASAAAKLL